MKKEKQKIDLHVHLKSRKEIPRYYAAIPSTYCTPEELLEIYDQMEIGRGVILPEVTPEGLYGSQSQEEIIEVVSQYPDRFSWFCNIDPRAIENSPGTDFTPWLQYYRERGAKGVGEVTANLYFDDPKVWNLFSHCEKNRMPVIFHMAAGFENTYGLVDDLHLPRLERTLQAFPTLCFLAHSQTYWAEISREVDQQSRLVYPSGPVIPGRVVELMRRYPNLCGDLSAGSGSNAVMRDPAFGYRFLEEFQDRLYYGTDICSPEDRMPLGAFLDHAVLSGHISQQAYEKICWGNAQRLLQQ